MSNETMTDARALADEYRPSMTFDVVHSWAAEAAARLRGEAAQSDLVTIESHWLQNILSAAVLLEGTGSILDKREADALRKMAKSATPAAPAPVAGDAVARLADELMDLSDVEDCHGNPSASIAFADAAGRLRTALAQDRASQGAAAGVPDAISVPRWFVEKLARDVGDIGMPKMEASLRAMLAAAPSAPTQGAEREVG